MSLGQFSSFTVYCAKRAQRTQAIELHSSCTLHAQIEVQRLSDWGSGLFAFREPLIMMLLKKMNKWMSLLLVLSFSHGLPGELNEEPELCRVCHIVRMEVLFASQYNHKDSHRNNFYGHGGRLLRDEPKLYSCITSEIHGYRENYAIELPQKFLDKYEKNIEEGLLESCIPEKYYIRGENARVELPDDYDLEPLNDPNSLFGRRNLQNIIKADFVGVKRLLAVRVTSETGESPEETLQQIEGAIFGTGGNPNQIPAASVVEQYEAISHGKLKHVPAKGNGIVNGVTEVQISKLVAGTEVRDQLSLDILEAATEKLGPLENITDYTIFCIPTGSLLEGSPSWTAFTFLYEKYSFFQQSRCTKLSVVMHERGHGLGFRHSGLGDDDYGDESGYMGYAVNRIGYPRKAFNGHKHWISGWYTEHSFSLAPLDASEAMTGRLICFVESDEGSVAQHDAVVIQLDNMYLQYNCAKGYNIETTETQADLVTITEADYSLSVSRHLAALGSGDVYTVANFKGSGKSLFIEVCDQIDSSVSFALISIYVDGQFSTCSNPNGFHGAGSSSNHGRQATSSPATTPTYKLTSSPTLSPTNQHTYTPTSFGAASQTVKGSPAPTIADTTSRPTKSPTNSPSFPDAIRNAPTRAPNSSNLTASSGSLPYEEPLSRPTDKPESPDDLPHQSSGSPSSGGKGNETKATDNASVNNMSGNLTVASSAVGAAGLLGLLTCICRCLAKRDIITDDSLGKPIEHTRVDVSETHVCDEDEEDPEFNITEAFGMNDYALSQRTILQ